MRRPASGIYITQALRPPYTVAVMWRGRVIEGRWVATYAQAITLAAELKEQLGALPIIDRTEHPEEERRAG